MAEPPLDRADLEKYAEQLGALAPPELTRIAREFYRADGRRPGDRYWRDAGHTVHLLATQAVQRFIAGPIAPQSRYGEMPG